MNRETAYIDAIAAQAAQHGDRIASSYGHERVTWSETLDRAARLAHGLCKAGVKPGDRVAVLSANSDLYLLLYLAIPWAGAIMVPLNNRWTPAENAVALDDCTPHALFCSDELALANAEMLSERGDSLCLISLGESRSGWLDWRDLLAETPLPPVERGGLAPWAIFYTGGTTGRSKGVVLSHAGFVANGLAMRDVGICPDGCRMLIVAPLFHLAAAAGLTWVMLAAGTAVIQSAFDPDATLDLIHDQQVTDALLVPTMIQRILDTPRFDATKLRGLRRIIYGASPMPEATLDRIMAAAPHVEFFQAYGMTEVSCTATILPPAMHLGAHRDAGRHRAAGLPLSTAELAIADPEGTMLGCGEVGEILVRGSGVMLGYWNQPELTAKTVRDGWMHTGDGGMIDHAGLLHVVDRLKDMIVTGGENVYSAEVESVIALHPDVEAVAVIGVPDADWGERVHAVIVPRGEAKISKQNLLDFCRSKIAGYKIPRSVELRQVLPQSPAGKVLKSELRAPFWDGRSSNIA